MRNRELVDLKKDKNIAPEDVARFALYENNLNDSNKFTAICDLVVCCERSQTTPLKQKITQLEAELAKRERQNSELREALSNSVKLAKAMYENFKIYKGEFLVQSRSWMADKVIEILKAEEALNKKDNDANRVSIVT